MPREPFSLKDLSSPERSQLGGFQRSVKDLAEKYGVAREKLSALAPKVIQFFKSLDAKYANLGGFVGFARLFDPKMPTHAADEGDERGYRNNRTYQALDYMRRIVNLQQREPRAGTQGRRDPATDQVARWCASILSIKGIDESIVWRAMVDEFKLGDRMLARFKARVEKVEPLIDLSAAAIKGPAKVIHMERSAAAAAPAAGPATVREALEGAARAVGVKGRNRRVHVAA